MGPVPEEGVSRLITQQTVQRSDHYERYGLALILEHGFMRTEKGQRAYRMNLEQLRNAVLETVYLGVLEAYLSCRMFTNARVASGYGQNTRTAGRLRGVLAQEVEDFATVQKNEHDEYFVCYF